MFQFFPADKELKVALIVINMPLGGMFDKFKKLCNTGEWHVNFLVIKSSINFSLNIEVFLRESEINIVINNIT